MTLLVLINPDAGIIPLRYHDQKNTIVLAQSRKVKRETMKILGYWYLGKRSFRSSYCLSVRFTQSFTTQLSTPPIKFSS